MVRAWIDRAIPALVLALTFLLPLTRRGVTIAASLLLLLWLLQGRLGERAAAVRSSPPLLAVLAFLLLNLASLAWSSDLVGGLDYLSKYRYLLLAAVVATAYPAARVGTAVDAFLLGSGLSAAWSYGIAIGLVRFGHGYPEHPAPSMNHLDYGMVLATAALLTLVRLARRSATTPARVGMAAYLLFLVGALLVNIGRSGHLAFFVALPLLLMRFLPGPRLLRPLLALALPALALVAAYAAVPVFHARVDAALLEVRQAVRGQEFATNQGKRVAGMIVAADLIRSHPLLGTGIGDTMPEFHRVARERHPDLAPAVRAYRHLHSEYLQVSVELGLVGLGSLLALFATPLRARTGTPELDDIARVAGWVFAVGCVADPFLHKQLPLILFSLLVGLVVAGSGSGSRAPSPRGGDPS